MEDHYSIQCDTFYTIRDARGVEIENSFVLIRFRMCVCVCVYSCVYEQVFLGKSFHYDWNFGLKLLPKDSQTMDQEE